MILKFADLGWAKRDAWAPDIVERNGKYYFYFSADSAIGVAVADAPTGPFVDALGKPLIPFEEDMSTIDPRIFIDDDGRTYLYWGATFDGKLFMREMNDDMISFKGEKITVFDYPTEEPYHCEGSYVCKRNGLYYYLWSEYIWCDSPALERDQSYRVNYAVSDRPEGPFRKELSRIPILSTDMYLKYIGPGHNSVLHFPGTDEYCIVYHQHQGDASRRFANIDRIPFGEEGQIYTIRMTETGVEAREIPCWLEPVETGPRKAGVNQAFHLGVNLPGQAVRRVTLCANGAPVAAADRPGELIWTAPQAGFYKVCARVTVQDGTDYETEALHVDVVEA